MTRRVTLTERRELLKRFSDDEDDLPEERFESTGRLPGAEEAEFDKAASKPPGKKWAKCRKYLRLIGAIALGIFETAIAVMFTFYVELREDWHRAALAAETFIIVSAIFVGIEARHRKKMPSVRRGLKLGAILFIYNAVIVPFATYFVSAFGKGAFSDDPALMASGLFHLIVGGMIALACIHHYRRTLTEPDHAPPLGLRPLWSFLRGLAKSHPKPEPVYQQQAPGRVIDVDFKARREWKMPSLPDIGFLRPQARAGRWMALLWLTYTQVQVWTAYDLIRNNEWRGLPMDDRAIAFYAAFAIMAFSFVKFLRSRKQIDLRDLRNLRLAALALLQAVVGIGLMFGEANLLRFGIALPPIAELVESFIIISGLTRFLLLLRNPVPRRGWRRTFG